MIATLNAVASVFAVIIIGYVLRQRQLVSDQTWEAVELLCFYLLFPFLIVRTLAAADFGAIPISQFAIVVVSAIFGMSFLLLLLRPFASGWLGMSDPSFTSLFQAATRWHGFMALAIVGTIYGPEGVTLVAIAIAIMVPLIQVLNVGVLAVFGDGARQSWLSVIKTLGKNPLMLACFAGGLLNITGLPQFAFGTLEIIGSAGLGLALLAVGAGIRLDHARKTKTLVAIGVLIRLVGMPLLMLLGAWLVGLEGLARTIAVIAGAVPTASTSYVMARRMGGDAELMANIITFQVLVAAITLPAFILIAEAT
jgi:malonate transporter